MTGHISAHFTMDEMADPMTGDLKLADNFIVELEGLREEYAHPIIVTGGCRSNSRNDWLRRRGYAASPNSFHLMENFKYKTGGCCAIDAARPNGLILHRLIEIALAREWTVGLGNIFIHLDRRSAYTNLKPTFYTY